MVANDTARLLMELETIAATLIPNADIPKLKLRFEEVTNNYNVDRKTLEALENDFKDKVDFYLSALRIEGYSEQTLQGNRYDLMAFSGFVNKAVIQVTTADVRKFLASNPKWVSGTVAKKLSTIKAFYKWMTAEEFILHDPTAKIRTPKQEKRLPKAMSPDELEMIRDACETKRERALVEVFYSTGCRISELSGMKTAEIDWRSGSLPVIGKGNKERIVYLNGKAIYELRKYLSEREFEEDECEYLFSTVRRPYKQMGTTAIRNVINKVASRVETSKKVTPHVFRHSMATNAINNGIELGDLQQLLGHSNPSTTLRYTMVSEERKRNAHKRFVQ
ncbi:tyrosine-type recombinase/integrase [Trichococcus collinsii]|uniref:Integrase/recombinase XerD n=1 Tax=Trichococcus collinsii TaxID=157076 RepID=A0AB38A441_9LACT|nr:tyrosine-type recombinase/integrase [Trichococcus collinsii]CZQ97839.1 integrase catalytic [Trichococcus collinsii]SEA97140.1 integrase/recombinase XerD [Trichococcus collinsii]